MVPNGTEISWENFQKVWEQLSFWNANHSTKSSETSQSKNEWKKTLKKKFQKIWVHHMRLSSFWKFWKHCSVCYQKLPKIQARSYGWMKSTLQEYKHKHKDTFGLLTPPPPPHPSQIHYTHIFFSYCTNMGWDSSQNCNLDYNQANYLRIRCSVQRKSCLIAWD